MKRVIFTTLTLFFYCSTNYSIIMAKQTSLFGKISGKIGSVIFSTSGGETISREYNPHVANPNTMAQVNQRARMKLMSQLSAALAPVIAMTKEGLVSKRNKFTKYNFENCYSENGVAQVSYENVQLTEGSIGLPSIVAVRAVGSGVTIQLAESAADSVSRVVYIMYRKTSEQKLQLVSSVIANAAGDNGTFPATLPYTEGDIVLYAYGMRDTNESATARYGSMQVANAVDVARLTAVRQISSEDYQFTQTRGTTMFSDESEISDVPEGSARVFVTALGNGNVSGAGIYQIGETAQVGAVANSGSQFVGWKLNGTNTIISTDPIYEFNVQGMTDLVAVFETLAPGAVYNVRVQRAGSNSSTDAKVKVGEQEGTDLTIQVNAGSNITVIAIDPTGTGFSFDGWFKYVDGNSVLQSEQNSYTFIPNGNETIIAKWSVQGL